VCWWCVGGVLVVCWWCVGGVLVVCWWCVVGVLVMCWWCVGDVLVVCMWCVGDMLVVWYTGWNIANKIHQKHGSEFVGYLHILDLINPYPANVENVVSS